MDFFDNIYNIPADEECICCCVKAPPPNYSSDSTVDYFSDEEFAEEELEEVDQIMSSYLALVTQSETVNLSEVMEKLSSCDNFQTISEDFNYMEFISSLKKMDKLTEESCNLQSSVNEVFDYLLQDDVILLTKLFLSVQWSRIFFLIRTRVLENVNKIVKRKEFTDHFGDLHSILNSKDLEREFAELMGIPVSVLAEHHFHAMTEIVLALNGNILKVIVGERFPSSNVESSQIIDVGGNGRRW